MLRDGRVRCGKGGRKVNGWCDCREIGNQKEKGEEEHLVGWIGGGKRSRRERGITVGEVRKEKKRMKDGVSDGRLEELVNVVKEARNAVAIGGFDFHSSSIEYVILSQFPITLSF